MPSNTEDVIWREPNQAQWRGVRPGYIGDQVTAYRSAVGVSVELYAVPAGKVLLVFQSRLSGSKSAAGTAHGYLFMLDAVPATVHEIHRLIFDGALSNMSDSHARFSPLVAPAGYSFAVQSSVGDLILSGGIEGILVDA